MIWSFGVIFLALPVCTLVLYVFLCFLHLPLCGVAAGVAIVCVLGAAALWWQRMGFGPGAMVAMSALFCVSLFGMVMLAGSVLDNSWDGMTYHQYFSLQMRDGWNPIYGMLKLDSEYQLLWRFNKGFEAIAACWSTVSPGGSIESGKSLHFVMFFAALFTSWRMFAELLARKRQAIGLAFPFALAAAFSPIAVCQIFTYLLDDIVGDTTLCLFSALTLVCLKPSNRSYWLGFVLSSILLLNLKLSSLVVFCVTCLFTTAVLFVLYRRADLPCKFVKVAVASAIVSVLFVGANPTVANVRFLVRQPRELLRALRQASEQERLAFPIELVRAKNPLEPLFLSLMCLPNNSQASDLSWPRLPLFVQMQREHPNLCLYAPQTVPLRPALPPNWDSRTLSNYKDEAPRVAGFGPLFFVAIAVSIVIIAGLVVRSAAGRLRNPDYDIGSRRGTWNRQQIVLLTFALISIAIALLMPFNAVARYIPQLWLVPIFLCAIFCAGERDSNEKIWLGISYAMCLLLFVNSGVVASVNWRAHQRSTEAFNSELQIARRESQRGEAVRLSSAGIDSDQIFTITNRLKEHNVAFELTDQLPAADDRCYRCTDQFGIVFGRKNAQ